MSSRMEDLHNQQDHDIGRRGESEEDGDEAEGSSSHAYPLIPLNTSLEMPSMRRGGVDRIEELDLIAAFGRPQFRAYFGIDPHTAHHAPLRELALYMRYARQSPEQVREMLVDARDRRVAAARREWEGKTEAEKAWRKWRVVECVMGADMAEVKGRLAGMIEDSTPEKGKKRKRRRNDDVTSMRRDVEPVHEVRASGNIAKEGSRSPLQDGVERINTSQAINPAASSSKARKLEDQEDTPLRQSTPAVTSHSTPQQDHASSPRTDRVSPGTSESPEEPVVPSSTASSLASNSEEETSQSSGSSDVVDPAEAPSANTTTAIVKNPASPLPVSVSTAPRTTGLTPIDECMIGSYAALVQNAPKALSEGQEITLKIGKGVDGKYYFENQLRNVAPTSQAVPESSSHRVSAA